MKASILSTVFAVCVACSSFASDDSPITSPEIAADNSTAAVAAARQKSTETARNDIKAGKLRIVLLSETGQIEGPYRQYDAETGYPLYSVAACEATACFLAEVEAYNEVMRKWHAEHK